MILDILSIFLGLAVLLVGGDLLVRGAVSLAAHLKISPLLVSLTIIAFGTSAPELVVAVTSVIEHQPGIAIGNILGSNIANVFLVLGLPALVYPITAHVPGLMRHAVVLLLATVLFAAIAFGAGELNPMTGAILIAGIIAYVAFLAYMGRKSQGRDPVIDEVAGYSEGPRERNLGAILIYIIAGFIGLPVGAHLLIDHGSSFALALAIRPEVIGLTVVAIGTSLPELATVAAAALHKKSDVAIGNVIGSNIFNLLFVAGAAGLSGTAAIGGASLRFDVPVMALSSILISVFILTKRDIGRLEGAFFIAAYAAFVAALAL